MSVGCVEPGIWRLFQNAAGEYPQNSVRAREIRRNNRLRLTLAAPRLLLVMAKNSVYASYTSLESLYHHLRSVYSGNSTPDFEFHANTCDDLNIPMWQQNNISSMAEDPEIYHQNSLTRVIDAAKHLDWRPHVSRLAADTLNIVEYTASQPGAAFKRIEPSCVDTHVSI